MKLRCSVGTVNMSFERYPLSLAPSFARSSAQSSPSPSRDRLPSPSRDRQDPYNIRDKLTQLLLMSGELTAVQVHSLSIPTLVDRVQELVVHKQAGRLLELESQLKLAQTELSRAREAFEQQQAANATATEQQLQDTRQQLLQEHTRERVEQEAKITALEKQLAAEQDKCASLLANLYGAADDHAADHSNKLERLIKQFPLEFATFRSRLQLEHSEALSLMEKQHQQTIKDLTLRFDRDRQLLVDSHRQDVQSVRAQFDKATDQLKQQAEQLKQLDQKHADQLETITKRLKEQCGNAYLKAVKKLKEDYQDKLRQIRDRTTSETTVVQEYRLKYEDLEVSRGWWRAWELTRGRVNSKSIRR